MIGRRKKATLKYVKDRIWDKINSWSIQCFPQADIEVLIKFVLQPIPLYVMSVFLTSGTLINEIENILNSFWWVHSTTNAIGLHWLSSERLATPKVFGGMGFKSLKAFNMVMVGKKAWKLISNPNALIT